MVKTRKNSGVSRSRRACGVGRAAMSNVGVRSSPAEPQAHTSSTCSPRPKHSQTTGKDKKFPFPGGQKVVKLDNPAQRDRLLQYMAVSASSGISSSSSHSSSMVPPLLSFQPPSQQCNRISGFGAPNLQESAELFSHSINLFAEVHPPPPASQGLDDTICSDAQSWELMEGGVNELGEVSMASSAQLLCRLGDESDSDTTQIPEMGVECSVTTAPAEQGWDSDKEEWEDTARDDDETLDPTYCQPRVLQRDSSEGEEEVEVTVRPPGQAVSALTHHSTASEATTLPMSGARDRVPNTSRAPSKSCLAWAFFTKSTQKQSDVICNLCHNTYSRGKNLLNLTTTVMTRHLVTKHSIVWQGHLEKTSESAQMQPSVSTSSSSSSLHRGNRSDSAAVPQIVDRPCASQSRPRPLPLCTQSSHGLPTSSPADNLESDTYSTQSQNSSQPSVQQMWLRKAPWPPTHAKTKSLNCSLAKFLATEMLPFRLVETESFRNFVSLACPKYQIPSRHFFSNTAMPALHKHVVDNITRSLQNSVSKRVHFTTDTWSSRHGQGRYITLTAHWVNLVLARGEGDGMSLHVLKSPRLAGQTSVHTETSSSAYSTSSNSSIDCTSQQEASRLQYCAFRGQRRQAVLHMRSLEDRRHTAEELWSALSADLERWLTPLNLTAGKVVSDNAANLLAAFSLGNLTHVPCMAHVLNLVVQKFMRHYPGLQELLRKVRSVSSHFRRSHPSSARLAGLQRSLGLPVNRLICDIPTRWNSTLHMLQRLCQQQQAIVQFTMQYHLGKRSVADAHFCHSEWTQMRDLCVMLQSFENATEMVSAEDAVISMAVPLIYLLEQTLLDLRAEVQSGMESEEEEEEEDVEGNTSWQVPELSETRQTGWQAEEWATRGSQNTSHTSTQGAGRGTQEDCEDDDYEMGTQGSGEGDELINNSNFVRGWPEEQAELSDSHVRVPSQGRGLGAQGSISHMSAFMLHFLQHDPRIKMVKSNAHYWVATMLDPRYKTKLSRIIPPEEKESRLNEYRTLLIQCLEREYTVRRSQTVDEQRSSTVSTPVPSCAARRSSSSSGARTNLYERWHTFFRPVHTPAAATVNWEEQPTSLQMMVQEYVALNFDALAVAPEPMEYWASKLQQWPELAQYALEILSCPVASVLSERVFSTAGGVLTDKRIRLSHGSVDRLTIIKMNKQWIAQDFETPLPECD